MNPELLGALAASTERAVVVLAGRWRSGELTDEQFVALATAALERAHSRVVALADLAVATALRSGALGLLPEPVDAPPFLAIADDDERLGIETRADVLNAGQRANEAAIKGHRARWTRRPNGGACPVCTDLADGVELPASTTMWSHKGCGCTQQPVSEEEAA